MRIIYIFKSYNNVETSHLEYSPNLVLLIFIAHCSFFPFAWFFVNVLGIGDAITGGDLYGVSTAIFTH